MAPISVIVVDDQALVREGLASLLSLMPELCVVGRAADGEAALVLVAEQTPNVALVDVRMPGMNGLAVAREISARFPATRVIILTTFEDDAYVHEALSAGAAGYLLKDADPEHLAAAIRDVHAGRAVLDSAVTRVVIERARRAALLDAPTFFGERLTDRERDVLRAVADGLSNAETAAKLFLAEGTVKNHVSRILEKLGARDRAQAVRLAVEWGLIRDG